jgi:hypothetical protein
VIFSAIIIVVREDIDYLSRESVGGVGPGCHTQGLNTSPDVRIAEHNTFLALAIHIYAHKIYAHKVQPPPLVKYQGAMTG